MRVSANLESDPISDVNRVASNEVPPDPVLSNQHKGRATESVSSAVSPPSEMKRTSSRISKKPVWARDYVLYKR